MPPPLNTDVINGLIEVTVADVESPASTLGVICEEFGVSITSARMTDYPDEYLHFHIGERGDPPLGVTVEFLPSEVRRSIIGTGTLRRYDYEIAVRVLWRDPATTEGKLTETPGTLRLFMEKFTHALAELFDPTVLSPTGAWTLPSGGVVGGILCKNVDGELVTEIRRTLCRSTEILFTCYTTA